MSWRQLISIGLAVVLTSLPWPALAQDPCPGNPIANASMEEGSQSSAPLGTQPGSVVATGWIPWGIWGYSSISREPQFDMEDVALLDHYSLYRVHSGLLSLKFSTNGGVHTGGIYQRVTVPKGAVVTFSIWVQIYTGQQSMHTDANKELISDLNSPGNYRVWVGLDPYGDVPPGFGAPPSERTVWSEPVLDRETRRFTENGLPYDGWVQLQITSRAEADHVTIFAKGQPEFPVNINVSYWDDACLTYVAPTRAPTNTPAVTATPKSTATPTFTATLAATATATATQTPLPTATPEPTATVTLRAPATRAPTATAAPTALPTRQAPPRSNGGSGENPFRLLLFIAMWLTAAGYLGWTLWKKRQTSAG